MTTLVFPNLETLQLAITSGVVPEEVSRLPARGHIDTQGVVTVQASSRLDSTALRELKMLGVVPVKSATASTAIEYACWLQLLPVRGSTQPLEYGENTAVLFELHDTEQLSDLVVEMLRLGNDRQSFRYLVQGNEHRALLWVMGPPYYSLLRALDGGETGPRAYLRQGERVWVQAGYVHPLTERIHPAPNQMLLLAPPHRWTFVDEVKFRDIYEVLELRLPKAAVQLREAPLSARIRVSLSLSAGASSDEAELWVLTEDAIAQLDALVGNADDRLLARLAFAVVECKGQPLVVLRTRPSKEPPPVLVVRGVAYLPYLKLPNLFLPIGRRLHPPLRRDMVSKLLAADRSLITWLAPVGSSQFKPQSLPDDAFRPLSDWVEYVLDHERETLATWAASTQFDFEPFVCHEDIRPQVQIEKRKSSRRRPDRQDQKKSSKSPSNSSPNEPPPTSESEPQDNAPIVVASSRQFQPNQLELHLRDLERKFISLNVPPDAPERRPLWRELARTYAAINRGRDATICWSYALWDAERPSPDEAALWLEDEERAAKSLGLSTGRLDKVVARSESHSLAPGILAAYLVSSAASENPPAEAIRHLSSFVIQLEKHEANLPLRAAWMAWRALAQLSGGDVLALAKARDRALERLFEQGLRPELDLPGFLRVAGDPDSERFHLVRGRIDDLRQIVHRWLSKTPPSEQQTAAYVDLIFAYANARLGEVARATELIQRAAKVLAEDNAIHSWLCEAFSLRIQTAAEGRPPMTTLPESLLSRLQQFNEAESYAIDRLRKESAILEPFERHDPYLRYAAKHGDELDQRLVRLIDGANRDELLAEARKLLAEHDPRTTSSKRSLDVLEVLLQIAPRLGETFALELLAATTEVLEQKLDLHKRAVLLERGLLLAGHFDRGDYVHEFARQFLELLKSEPRENIANDAFEALLKHCFHSLRKLGQQKLLDAIALRLAAAMRTGRHGEADRDSAWYPAEARRIAHELKRGTELMHVGKILLQLAAVRFQNRDVERALGIIDDIRKALLFGQFEEGPRMRLARAYVAALSEAPIELAYQRIEELFGKLPQSENKFIGTMKYYHIWELVVAEAAVMALVGDGLHLNAQGRQWLEEDEFLVRRRIHRDVRQVMAQEAS